MRVCPHYSNMESNSFILCISDILYLVLSLCLLPVSEERADQVRVTTVYNGISNRNGSP